jgi:predicted metal-dependent phosphoesterase TrpH
MNREKWEFSYLANTLADAAKEKVEHHQARLRWWSERKEQAFTTLRQEGIAIDESLIERDDIATFAGAPAGQAASFRNLDYRAPTVQVRPDLVRDLNETVAKIREHEAKITTYDGWEQVLRAQGENLRLTLQHDDWLFFFGRPVRDDR